MLNRFLLYVSKSQSNLHEPLTQWFSTFFSSQHTKDEKKRGVNHKKYFRGGNEKQRKSVR